MRKSFALLAVLLLITAIAFADAAVKDIIITPTNPSNLKIQLWMDRPTGATYYPGDSARVYFKVSKDAYVVIYDYTTDGKVRMLFPNYFQMNNYVQGGVVYMIPDPRYNYSLVVAGPNGREFLEAVATTSQGLLKVPYLGNADPFVEYPNGRDYMQKLKLELLKKPIAVATTYFYVGYTPTYGTVNFTSNPIGASLYVDGIYEGETPQTLKLSTGSHVAVFRYKEQSVTKSFTVQAGVYQTVNAVIPMIPVQPLQVNVKVRTYPSGALIFVNGKMLGVTSCTLKLSPGTYEFTILKPGYHTIVQVINVQSDTTLSFNMSAISNYTSY